MRCYRLDLTDNVGGDKLLEVDHTDVVKEAEVELLELQRGKIEAAEDTELMDLEEGLERLELEQGCDIERLLLEKTLELENVEVVDVGQVAKEPQLQGVDVEQVVQVDLLEVLETVQGIDIKVERASLKVGDGSRRGSNSQGGKSGDEESDRLHFDWVV